MARQPSYKSYQVVRKRKSVEKKVQNIHKGQKKRMERQEKCGEKKDESWE